MFREGGGTCWEIPVGGDGIFCYKKCLDTLFSGYVIL